MWRSYLYEPDSFRPLALVEGNARKNQKIRTYWYQNDHLGTPHSLTDSLGGLVYSCTYNAYGQVQTETQHQQQERGLRVETNLRFQGQYADEETGLFYNLNRYYDPALGRYLTADPIKLAGGLNQYRYCLNPITWIDPLGLIAGLGSNSSTGPYDPHVTRQQLEDTYGKGNVSSTTVPGANDKNVKLKGQRYPNEPNVVYDSRGYPIFDDVASFDTKLPDVAFGNAEYTGQMRMASQDLWKAIQRGEVSSSQFTKEQLAAIKAGKSKIPDFTWHHHQDFGRMQLVPTKIHGKAGHIGGDKMSKGR